MGNSFFEVIINNRFNIIILISVNTLLDFTSHIKYDNQLFVY